ncbi:Pycsar system effector family protein [Membranihabitans marinus]|uniref:Pycsar system effector family protein n=1 Tax=Membranihabitans marinus TaxID=1227546 RepID=UPI001F1B2410|nr:Pycsar system effector family protein [Membranihabitans marinus]
MANIINKAQQYATDLLTNILDHRFLYHNLVHTQRVVRGVTEIVNFYQLEDSEKEVLLLTAWLHDIGYTKGSENHEENSVALAKAFFEREDYQPQRAQKVYQYIMATKHGHVPQNIAEEIIRDADCSHFSKKSFIETSELLREELALLNIANYSSSEWQEENIKHLRSGHQYYSDYAMKNWHSGKDKNLKRLLKAREEEKQLAKKEALKSKYKEESPERGIQTLYRVTMTNHLKLSDIADTKANILLSVNAIVISLALSNLIPKLDNSSNTYLIVPSVIFVFFAVVSMILSVLATRPNVTAGKFSKEDVENKNVNLLFFGNFHQMSLQDYDWAMKELIKDKDYIYSTLTKDLYFLGKVLDRKYKILWWTYTIFITGMTISVIAFAIAFKYFQ